MTSPRWYADPGHAWLMVDTLVYPDARRVANASDYSWIYQGTAFLEEDCDAGKWLALHPEIDGRNLPEDFHNARPPRGGGR